MADERLGGRVALGYRSGMMKRLIPALIAVCALSAPLSAQAQAPHPAGPIRLALAGGPGFANGVELALREINGRGGITGRQAVIVPSGADLTLDPQRFADPPSPLARYLVGPLQAKSVAIAARSTDEMRFTPIGATPLVIEAQQADFSATVLRAKNSGADALIIRGLSTDESVGLLTELRKQNYGKPVLGEAALVSARLIERAGEAANGVRAVVGLGPETPMPAIADFQRKHRAVYGGPSGVDAMRGYAALYVVKAVSARLGRVDSAAFAEALKNLRLSAQDEPGLLLDVFGDANGLLRHQLLVVEVRDKKAVAIDVLSAQ